MVHTSFVLIAGLIFLINYKLPETGVEFNNVQVVFWTGVLTIAPVLLAYFTRRLTALRATLVFEILSLAGYVCALYLLHLPGFVNKLFAFLEVVHHSRELLSLIPLFVSLLGVRVAMHEIRQAKPEHRWEPLNFYFRTLLFPLIVVSIWNGVIDFSHLLPDGAAALFLFIMIVPLFALPHILAPYMMQFLWKTVPLTNIELKQKLQQLTDRSRMKYRDVVVWQTGGFAIANAAVAGIIPRNRRIFITDALLHNFTDEQIETVVAHEIGHIRHKHLLISVFLVFIYLLSSILFFMVIGKPLRSLLSEFPILLSLVSILFFVFYFKVFFNYLSRRFEHQADLYAVDLTNNPEAFKSALTNLGFFSSFPKLIRFVLEIFNTHPSLERRIEFLDKAVDVKSSIQRYRKCLLEVKVLIALIPIFGVIIYLIT